METYTDPIVQKTIGEIVASDWRQAEVFKKYGIDFCCGGKRTVAEACEQKDLDVQQVEHDLLQVIENQASSGHHFIHWNLDFLADYIVNNHHAYVREAIPFLTQLNTKVAQVHGGRHPELNEIEQHVAAVTEELAMHMRKEETVLFPYIHQMALAQKNNVPLPRPAFGTIANPIAMMESEHTSAGHSMDAIQSLSGQFTPPADACTSYKVLFAKLQEFQQDLFQHVHLENNILFPQALKLEAQLFSKS